MKPLSCTNRALAGLVLSLLVCSPAAAQRTDAQIKAYLDSIGTKRGLCVILGDAHSAVDLAQDLARGSELRFYIQNPDAIRVNVSRGGADNAGLLGTRIFIQQGSWSRIHLADNLADAVVVGVGGDGNGEGKTPHKELMRILRPGGKLVSSGKIETKPVPTGIDEWTHPYHGPDNNPQSQDKLAKAPYLTHFTAEPWYCPMPLVTVASGGRMFKAFGHVAVKEREWPYLSTLIGQNAYNGTILWKRPLDEGFMIHRNTLIATPTAVYLGDNKSCKVLDAATGEVKDEIVIPKEVGDSPAWKWMALVDGTLYAMVGKEEASDPTMKGNRLARGWPWRGGALGKGYDSKVYGWGFGNTILAINPKTKKVLWSHTEKEPLDTRAMCMAGQKIYFYSHGKFLACLDAKNGKPTWRTTDEEVLKAIGDHREAQNPNEGFTSSAYVKCNDDALYFAGPVRTDLTAVSAKDGKLLWTAKGRGNSQLVLRDDGLYAMSPGKSTRFEYLTGKELQTLGARVNCTRATGSIDSIFVRGGRDGTIRYDLASNQQQHMCPMRPSCQDGVLPVFGHLYWGPWMCDCNLTLVGVISVEPAGDFDFAAKVNEKERFEKGAGDIDKVAELAVDATDWPTLRANNKRAPYSPIAASDKAGLLWSFSGKNTLGATAPVSAGGMVFIGSGDGAVRAFDANTGKANWTAYTGGAITYPPTIWKSRLFVGSGDGWIYSLEAKTGRMLWRFRAAPIERTIPVYDSLRSTWPVAGGVLVEGGVLYAAAGLANHDGTHVYALDAITGKMKWHNGSSGAIHPQNAGGVSVNGHLLLHGGRLHLAGGNVVPVASYDLADGKCLTDPTAPQSHTQFKAGSDLFVVNNTVTAAGNPLYSTKGDYRMISDAIIQTPAGDVKVYLGPHNSTVSLLDPNAAPGGKPRWSQKPVSRVYALAMTKNALLIAGSRDAAKQGDPEISSVLALSLKDGEVLWKQPLPAQPTPWGFAVDREGRVIVSLQDGRMMCFGAEK